VYKRQKILIISKYKKYVNHRNAKYLQATTARQSSKFLVLQRINSRVIFEILSILKYQ